MAQQVFGGHGYIAEHGMEQFVRDARIAMIYEGTNGIQALDLVGRKLPKDGGRAVHGVLRRSVRLTSRSTAPTTTLAPFVRPLGQALGDLQQATMWFMQNALGNPDNAGAGSTDYMHLFGLVALGYMWCADRRGCEGQGGAGNGASAAHGGEARHRPLLHGAHAARDRDPPGAHQGRRRHARWRCRPRRSDG